MSQTTKPACDYCEHDSYDGSRSGLSQGSFIQLTCDDFRQNFCAKRRRLGVLIASHA